MQTKVGVWSAVLLSLRIGLGSSSAAAQDSLRARVVGPDSNGSYLVEIGTRRMLAIPDSVLQAYLKMKADLRQLRRDMALKDSLLASRELVLDWCDSTVRRQKQYVTALDSLYRGYKSLTEGYRRLSAESWLTFDGGLGATGKDHKPAVIAGLGIRRVRIWGFLQEANAGGFVGVSLRLF